MLVRIVKDWQYPESFFEQTPNGSHQWGNIKFTDEKVLECDYLIVLQRPPYDIKAICPEGNTWLITQEPPVEYFRFYTRSFKYFDKVFSYYDDVKHADVRKMQPVLPWHVFKSYDHLTSITRDKLAQKKDELVWITSNKSSFPGHVTRMMFLEYLEKQQFRYNLYGSGFQSIYDKFDGLFPNKYSLAIENYSTQHYWTEKIADSFLSWCLPFYWGAPNIADFFPEESFIRIDINDPKQALEIITAAIKNNEWKSRLDAIEKARSLVLNNYQFFPYISKLIEEDKLTGNSKSKKKYFIPENPFPLSHTITNQIKYYTKRLKGLF